MPTVILKDKNVELDFPDTMSQDEIKSAIKRHYYPEQYKESIKDTIQQNAETPGFLDDISKLVGGYKTSPEDTERLQQIANLTQQGYTTQQAKDIYLGRTKQYEKATQLKVPMGDLIGKSITEKLEKPVIDTPMLSQEEKYEFEKQMGKSILTEPKPNILSEGWKLARLPVKTLVDQANYTSKLAEKVGKMEPQEQGTFWKGFLMGLPRTMQDTAIDFLSLEIEPAVLAGSGLLKALGNFVKSPDGAFLRKDLFKSYEVLPDEKIPEVVKKTSQYYKDMLGMGSTKEEAILQTRKALKGFAEEARNEVLSKEGLVVGGSKIKATEIAIERPVVSKVKEILGKVTGKPEEVLAKPISQVKPAEPTTEIKPQPKEEIVKYRITPEGKEVPVVKVTEPIKAPEVVAKPIEPMPTTPTTPEKVVSEEKPSEIAKEPYQMTKEEYIRFNKENYELLDIYKNIQNLQRTEQSAKILLNKKKATKEYKDLKIEPVQIEEQKYPHNKYIAYQVKGLPNYDVQLQNEHKNIIKQSLSAGKTVPPEVLKDYPELQKEVQLPETKTKIEEPKEELVPKISEEISKKIPTKVPPVGLGIEKVKPIPKDEIILPKDENIKFKDVNLEQSFQQAKGIRPENLGNKLKDLVTKFWHSATRVYPELPNTPEYAELRNILYRQKNNKTKAQYDTIILLRGITDNLGKNQLDLFTKKIILDDLTFDSSKGKVLPFGLTEETLNTEKTRIDKIIEENPIIKEAITKRKEIQKTITDDLIKYKILKEEQTENPNYFHHQVLEYANAKGLYGTGRKLRKPSPGFAKKREGTELAINTDYLQAEYEYMAQALHDTQTAKHLKEIETSELNIKDKLLEKYGKEEWRNNIPEGYKVWQPREGRIFYTAQSVPENFLEKIQSGILPEELIKQITAIGGRFKEFVLPENVANTLDNLYAKPTSGIAGEIIDYITKQPITLWKRWVLFNPIRLIKYNYQNMLGDLDALIASNPTALKKTIKATSELYDYYYGNKPMSKDLYEAFSKNVVTSGLTMSELPEIRDMEFFRRFSENKNDLQKYNIIKNWFQYAGKISSFRENILRYSAYLDYRERFRTNDFKNKWVLKYGGAKQSEVDELKTPEDKAAKVATATLGDYGNLSALGQEIRDRAVPFYSWLEINLKRYPQFLENAYKEGKGAGISAKIGVSIGRFLLKASALWGIIQIWNNTRYPEVEDELNEYDKRRMHINIGKMPDGRPMILRGQGALSDFFEWFGLNQFPRLTQLLSEGKIDLNYASKELAKAPINKAFGGISPLYKAPIEYLMGVSLFPDILEPRQIRDKNRQIIRNFQLEDIYDWIKGNPQRPLIELLLKPTPIIITDPKQNAYNDIQNLKRLYLEKQGKGTFTNTYFTPRSQAMYNYRLALKLKDKKSIEKYKNIIRDLNINQRQATRSLDPFTGLTIREKIDFKNNYLNIKDKEKLKLAEQFYRETLLQQ